MNFMRGAPSAASLRLKQSKDMDWVFRQLGAVARLHDGWDGHGSPAPNSRAIANAAYYVFDTIRLGYCPDEIDVDVMGGVAIWFHGRHERGVMIMCSNSGARHKIKRPAALASGAERSTESQAETMRWVMGR